VLTIVHSMLPLLLDPAFVMATAHLERDLPNLAIATKALVGWPRELIVEEAADWGADLVVLGSHGQGA
jgi:nucleotide-binding universal stress UspA family protein